MPGIIVAFFVLVGVGTGSGLMMHPGKDHRSRTDFGDPVPIEYRAWSAQTDRTQAKDGVCPVTFFALQNRRTRMRMRVNGNEKLLDFSWTVTGALTVGEWGVSTFEFLEPEGGAVVATRRVEVCCQDMAITCGSLKDAAAPLSTTYTGKPRLKLWAPRVVPARYDSRGNRYGVVHVSAEILGEMTEEWYCPMLEWTIRARPSGEVIRTWSRQSDCEPWPGEMERRWSTDEFLGTGSWAFEVRVIKGGRVLAQQTVNVSVGGREVDDWLVGGGK